MGKGKKKAGVEREPTTSKKPRVVDFPQPQKKARSEHDPGSSNHLSPVWRTHIMDHQGQWTWLSMGPRVADVLAFLGSLESMTWQTILGRRHHAIAVESLCKDAQKRLEELGQDDVDVVYSLAMTGKERIIGIRDNHVLKLLWWDPEHEVCPSSKKHT